MEQYVLLRIMTLDGIDLNLFEFDRHNALYFFMINADEHIYMRYGGRDAESATSYLDFESLELALDLGLEQHRRYQAGDFIPQPKKAPLYPKEIQTLKTEVIDNNRCVECHLVGDFRITEKETAGELVKAKHMYQSPDIKTIGIHLDVPKGLEVKETHLAVADAGMQPGDLITHLNNHPIFTFGDLQFEYNKVERTATEIMLTVQRGELSEELLVKLPDQWWHTDLTHRYWSIDPLVFFEAERLSEEEKIQLEVPVEGFASRVSEVDINALLEGAHDLEEGDIILAVNGVKKNLLTQDVVTHIKLMHEAGSSMDLEVIRSGARQKMPLTTKRQSFRK